MNKQEFCGAVSAPTIRSVFVVSGCSMGIGSISMRNGIIGNLGTFESVMLVLSVLFVVVEAFRLWLYLPEKKP